MKTFSGLALALFVLSTVTGCHCCRSYQSNCVDWNDGCYADQGACCGKPHCRRHGKSWRHGKGCCKNECCETCGTCGDAPCGTCSGGCETCGYSTESSCSGCATGTPTMGAPVTEGCAGGSCGNALPTYGGLPIDPSSGWTVQPMPAPHSEPLPAPPAGAAPQAAVSPAPAVPQPVTPR